MNIVDFTNVRQNTNSSLTFLPPSFCGWLTNETTDVLIYETPRYVELSQRDFVVICIKQGVDQVCVERVNVLQERKRVCAML